MRYFVRLGDQGSGVAETEPITGIVQRVHVDWQDGTSSDLPLPPGQQGKFTIWSLQESMQRAGLPFEVQESPPAP